MTYIEIQEAMEKQKNLQNIADAQMLVAQMKVEVKKYVRLLELAESERIKVVQNNTNYLPYLFRIQAAKDYFADSTKKMDKRSSEYKEIKTAFDSLQKFLSSDEMFGEPVNICGFYFGGYDCYYYEVVFTLKDHDNTTKYTFTVPDVKKLNKDNFEHACEGKLAFGRMEHDENVHDIIETSYDIKDIIKVFKENI